MTIHRNAEQSTGHARDLEILLSDCQRTRKLRRGTVHRDLKNSGDARSTHTRGDPGLWCQAGDRHGRDNWRTLFATLTAALPGAVAVIYMECPEWGMWMASVSLGGNWSLLYRVK